LSQPASAVKSQHSRFVFRSSAVQISAWILPTYTENLGGFTPTLQANIRTVWIEREMSTIVHTF